MRGKCTQLFKEINSCNFNIIIFTETWLNDSFTNQEIFGNDWLVYRNDRDYQNLNVNRGGGVLIAIHKSIPSEGLEIIHSNLFEIVFVKIKSKFKNICLGSVYIPPNSVEEIYSEALHLINDINLTLDENDDIFVFGDFNRPNLSFIIIEEDQCLYPMELSTNIDFMLIDTFYGNDMVQILNIKNDLGHYLDLIFTNVKENVTLSEVTETERFFNNTLHHKAMSVSYNVLFNHCVLINDDEFYLDFKNANYASINNYILSFDWCNLCTHSDINYITEEFYLIINNAIEMFVPKVRNKKQRSEPWLNDELRALRNRRNKAFKKLKHKKELLEMNKGENDIQDIENEHSIFDSLFNEFKAKSSIAYNQYINNLGEEILNNPKKFFDFVNNKRKTKGYPTTMRLDQLSSSNPGVISDLFADKFQSVYGSPHVSNNLFDHILPCLNIDQLYLTNEEILLALKQLDITKGSGPDGVPPLFLRNCSESIASPLYFIFNKSLETGVFPKIFKPSFITPIYKSGSRIDISNYRGIANQSAIPKLFEKKVNDKISEKVARIMNNEQHGFLKHKSTITNLVVYTSSIINQMEQAKQIDAVYTDFSKAFDRVNHKILTDKLACMGFSNNVLNWIKSYLSDRTQQVKFQGKLSKTIFATTGVPQGSHLGPTLFNLFIRDLSLVLDDVNHILYADDLKIYQAIDSFEDAIFLQDKINILKDWCDINDLQLNSKKCQVISFTRKVQEIKFDYSIGTEKMNRVKEINDLGVILDSKLNFKAHWNCTIARAYKLLGFIKRRAKEFNNIWVSKTLYISYVRSILEYASIVWMPYTNEHIKHFESVQKQFLLFALRSLYNPSDYLNLPKYEHRLNIIQLETLNFRRNLLGACFTFDILENNIKVNELKDAVKMNNNRLTRHSPFLLEPFHHTTYGRNEPITRCIRLFNEYSKFYDRNSNNSKFTFKKRIKNAEKNNV